VESQKPEAKKEEPRIDPSVPWHEEHNRDAARNLGWRYDRNRGFYVDQDGEIVADIFGQPL
jgi:hypothetical protein